MANILCTSHNRKLLKMRKLVLEGCGHCVTIAVTEEEARGACAGQAFDLAVIGHTVAPPEKDRILALVRRHSPAAVVLEVYTRSTGRELADADDWLDIAAETRQELEARVTALLSRPRA